MNKKQIRMAVQSFIFRNHPSDLLNLQIPCGWFVKKLKIVQFKYHFSGDELVQLKGTI